VPGQSRDHEIQLPGRFDKPTIPVPSLPSYLFMGAPAIRSTFDLRREPTAGRLHGGISHRILLCSSMLIGGEYASWIVGSFTARGGYSCDGVPSNARGFGVLATADFLAKRPDVQGNNIAVMGFSHRGSIVLDAVAMAADRQVNASRGTLLT